MKKLVFYPIISLFILIVSTGTLLAAESITCWFPASWIAKSGEAKAITDALSQKSGVDIKPRIARNYPQILEAFSSGAPSLVYVGSFVQAIIDARDLGEPLVQSINGKEFYSGILVYPKGKDPVAILRDDPTNIAYTIGASSGESSAKAATYGKASIAVANHMAATRAVKFGKASAAVVKNWWWESNKSKFPELHDYNIPGISLVKNPDNVLTASKSVSADVREKIKKAAIASQNVFGAKAMKPFDKKLVGFSLELMKKGNIDPIKYDWN